MHLRQTLEILRRHHLIAKPSKCQWGATSLTYLGHQVGHWKVLVPECRVEAIRKFQQPRTKSELRAFLGTVGYYRRFIRNFSSQAIPLTEATKNAAPNVVAWNITMNDEGHPIYLTICHISLGFIPTLTSPN